MLALRPTDIDGQTEYFLDCAVDNNSLDAGSRIILVLYGDKERVEAFFAVGENRNYYRYRHRMGELSDYATKLFTQLDPVRQIGAVLLGMSTLRHNVNTTAQWMAQTAIEDTCEGGSLKDYLRWRLPAWDTTPPKKGGRRLHSPRWVRSYVRGMSESDMMRRLHGRIWDRVKLLSMGDVTRETVRAAHSIFDADLDAQRDRLDAHHNAGYARLDEDAELRRHLKKHGVKFATKRTIRKDRKKKVRAAITAASVVGPQVVNRFIAGKPVDLQGQAVILTVQRRARLNNTGHGSVHLKLRDLDRSPLAALCFYIDDTPTIDQLTALALAMQCGEEAEILEHANVTSATSAGCEHPLLREKIASRGAFAAWQRRPEQTRPSSAQLRNARDLAYWQRTKDIWINTLGQHVFGRTWGTFLPFIEESA